MNGTTPPPQEVRIRSASVADLYALWSDPERRWPWECPFVSPPWLAAWWQCFGRDFDAMLLVGTEGNLPVGVAPLMVKDRIARFMGSDDLCDYGDFPSAPAARERFFTALVDHLRANGVERLELASVRPDSAALLGLVPAARDRGCRVTIHPGGVSVQMRLPATWDDYLLTLKSKQRHEVRRKFRRAGEVGTLVYHPVRRAEETAGAMETFLGLFRRSRPDKYGFMTPEKEVFFTRLAHDLSRYGMLDLSIVEIGGEPAAAVFCISHGQTTYLYNNGFEPGFRGISIGVLSKLMTIRASIDSGKRVYDFLNGDERYKYRLGGSEVKLSGCVVSL